MNSPVKRDVIIMFFLLLMVCRLNAQNSQLERQTTKVGTTAAQFLKIPAGARAVAMGGSAVAMDGDVYSIYWNPGALSRMSTGGEASFNHVQWLADIDYNYMAVGLTIDGFGTIGLSVTSLQSPQEIVRTETHPDGDGRQWRYGAFSMGLSFARSLTDRFAIGFTGKYVHEGIWNMSAQGFGFDVGTIYTTSFNDLKIGASISNFGSKMQLSGYDISFNNFPNRELGQGAQNVESRYKMDEYDLPLMLKIGFAIDAFQVDNIRATVAIDATHPNDNTEYLNSGIEIAYDEMIFARGGYKSLFKENSEEGLTWGFGVNFGVNNTTAIKIDYAFADFGRLTDVQYVSASITF